MRDIQGPLDAHYREASDSAVITLKAKGTLGSESITCNVETGRALRKAGLHPTTGGDGLSLCSGDMFSKALVACAGVTLKAVAASLDLPLRVATVSAEGYLDFRGTPGVDREASVGFQAIQLHVDIDCPATPDQVVTLLKLTERHCVLFQTLNKRPHLTVSQRVTGR